MTTTATNHKLAKQAAQVIIDTAKAWGFTDIMVTTNTSPMNDKNLAVYIDGDVYDAYNDYSGIFADEVRAKLSGFYLEPYTYSILDVVEG